MSTFKIHPRATIASRISSIEDALAFMEARQDRARPAALQDEVETMLRRLDDLAWEIAGFLDEEND